jgi:hypothetical protein
MLDVARVRRSPRPLPRWAQPPVAGALIIFQLTGRRMLPVVPFVLLLVAMKGGVRSAGVLLAAALGALLAAAVAGAIGGLTYSLLSPLLLRMGWLGARLLGILCVAAYLAPLLLGYVYLSGGTGLADPGFWISLSICSLLFGYMVGGMFGTSAQPAAEPSVAADAAWDDCAV